MKLSKQRDREGLREQGVCHRYELEIFAGTENGDRKLNTIYIGLRRKFNLIPVERAISALGLMMYC